MLKSFETFVDTDFLLLQNLKGIKVYYPTLRQIVNVMVL